jgi:hypothetical protein
MRYLVFSLLLALTTSICLAEEPGNSDYLDLSKVDSSQQFHFLVGDWSYATANNVAHGKSSGRLQVSASVVTETTHGNFGESVFIGQALYLYNSEQQQWRQNWIDSLGSVLETEVRMGEYAESEFPAMIGELEFQGQKLKHVWYNTTDNGYQTDLLAFNDESNAYQLIRRMPYSKMDN